MLELPRRFCEWHLLFARFNISLDHCVLDVTVISIIRVSKVRRFRLFGAILGMEGHWKKILTLLTFYNTSAALVCGFLIAILMMILFCYRLLPNVDRAGAGDAHRWSNWCLCSGFLMTTLLTFLWRSQKKIFLDRLCISQKDDRLKAQAIFSLAGLLKKSDVMLILWDPTWTETCLTFDDFFACFPFWFCCFKVFSPKMGFSLSFLKRY